MKTNHPARGPVSLERLHQISEILSKAAAQSDGGNLGYAMADAVKVIDGAIAAFGAEPVGYFYADKPGDWYQISDGDRVPENRRIPLYSNPQSGPVVKLPNEFISSEGIVVQIEKLMAVLAVHGIHYERRGNACRAAMLQAGNHTEQHLDMVYLFVDINEKVDFRLPFDQWLSQQNEPIDVDCGCVTTEAFYHWLRVAYDAGNSPATSDGWIPVSERMPNDKDFVWCWGYVSGWPESDGFEAYYDATRNKWWTVDDETVRKITHWMPLPAAPQQEVK